MGDAKTCVNALIEAEERGITQTNVDAMVKQAEADPSQTALRRFLGVDPGLGRKLGLPDDFVQVIEPPAITARSTTAIWDQKDVAIPRGANRLAGEGGLMISPPFT